MGNRNTCNFELFFFSVSRDERCQCVPEELKVTLENETSEILHAIEAPEGIRNGYQFYLNHMANLMLSVV